MATDLTVKTLENEDLLALGTAVTAYLSGGGWNKADIVALEFAFKPAQNIYSTIIMHLTTPT